MAAPFQKFDVPKEIVDETYKAVEIATETGKIKRGVNETTKALERGVAKLVIIAGDVAPPEIVAYLPKLSDEKQTPYVVVPSRKDLGTASGVNVPTSSIAIIEAGNAKDLISGIAKKVSQLKK